MGCFHYSSIFIIVQGTQSSEEVTEKLQAYAVYIANLFFLTADTYAPIVKDKDLTREKAGKEINEKITIKSEYHLSK